MASTKKEHNLVREFRLEQFMTQNDLAKKAKVASRTLHSIEKGFPCRQGTKRKILIALGFSWQERDLVWPENVHPLVLSTREKVNSARAVFYADAVKKRRKSNFITQKELAQKLRVSLGCVQRLEEEKPVRISTARKVFKFLRVKPVLKLF
jgi:DNA-binding XRE family transcriptional regulator